jgi:hypothetical protein
LRARGRRTAKALRVLAWGAVVAGVAAPFVRRKLRLPAPAVIGTAALAPFAWPSPLHARTRRRHLRAADVGLLAPTDAQR